VKKNERLVQRRRGARRRSKLKLLFQLIVSLVFLGTAALLSAGIVQVVERPVAPWTTNEPVESIAQPAPAVIDETTGAVELEVVERVQTSAPIDPAHARLLLREASIDDLPEAVQIDPSRLR
jgi:hypothetical protein